MALTQLGSFEVNLAAVRAVGAIVPGPDPMDPQVFTFEVYLDGNGLAISAATGEEAESLRETAISQMAQAMSVSGIDLAPGAVAAVGPVVDAAPGYGFVVSLEGASVMPIFASESAAGDARAELIQAAG